MNILEKYFQNFQSSFSFFATGSKTLKHHFIKKFGKFLKFPKFLKIKLYENFWLYSISVF